MRSPKRRYIKFSSTNKLTMPKEKPKDIEEKIRLYQECNMSAAEIAERFDTYAKKIQRELKAAGCPLRGRSEAQKIRLSEGKAEHPTQGKEVSQDTKNKISDAMAEKWNSLTPEQRAVRSEMSKVQWDKREDKEAFIQAGLDAVRKASVEGSKFEKYLSDALLDQGYKVYLHEKHQVDNEKMHLDLFLPNESIAIEVDGPAHYKQLYKEVSLADVKDRDRKKNLYLTSKNIDIIRVSQPSSVSDHFMRTQSARVILKVEEIIAGNYKNSMTHYINH